MGVTIHESRASLQGLARFFHHQPTQVRLTFEAYKSFAREAESALNIPQLIRPIHTPLTPYESQIGRAASHYR